MLTAILLGVIQLVLILLGVLFGLALLLAIVVLIKCVVSIIREEPMLPRVVVDASEDFKENP
jgi:hypothetical protein